MAEAIRGVGNLPVFTTAKAHVYASAVQTIPTGTHTILDLDTAAFDPASWFDAVNHKLTVSVPGVYLLIGSVGYNTPVADKLILAELYVNGAYKMQCWGHTSSTNNIVVQTCGIRSLAVGDYVQLYTYHNFGVDGTTLAGFVNVSLYIHLLSAS